MCQQNGLPYKLSRKITGKSQVEKLRLQTVNKYDKNTIIVQEMKCSVLGTTISFFHCCGYRRTFAHVTLVRQYAVNNLGSTNDEVHKYMYNAGLKVA
jgi:hypothetical protein